MGSQKLAGFTLSASGNASAIPQLPPNDFGSLLSYAPSLSFFIAP
jgi:hypothetical protein